MNLTLRYGVRNAWKGEEWWVEKKGQPRIVFVADRVARSVKVQMWRWGYFRAYRAMHLRADAYVVWWLWPWLVAWLSIESRLLGAYDRLYTRGILYIPDEREGVAIRLRDTRIRWAALRCFATGHNEVVIPWRRRNWYPPEWQFKRVCVRCGREK